MCISAAVATTFSALATLKSGRDAAKAAQQQAQAVREASRQQAAQAAESARAAAQQQQSEIERAAALRQADIAAQAAAMQDTTPEVQVGQDAIVASGESVRRRKVGASFNIRGGGDSAANPGGLRL